jgi:hypothetical protein
LPRRGRYAADPAIRGRVHFAQRRSVYGDRRTRPFDSELFDQAPNLWVPFQIDPTGQTKDARLCYVTARLEPGVTLHAARAQMHALAQDYEHVHPAGLRLRDDSAVQPVIEALSGKVRLPLLILAGARSREFAIRAALGGTRLQIVRPLLAETGVLSLAGGALGRGAAVGIGRNLWADRLLGGAAPTGNRHSACAGCPARDRSPYGDTPVRTLGAHGNCHWLAFRNSYWVSWHWLGPGFLRCAPAASIGVAKIIAAACSDQNAGYIVS